MDEKIDIPEESVLDLLRTRLSLKRLMPKRPKTADFRFLEPILKGLCKEPILFVWSRCLGDGASFYPPGGGF